MKGIFSTILFWIFTNGGTEEKCRVTCFVYSKAKAGIWQFWACNSKDSFYTYG